VTLQAAVRSGGLDLGGKGSDVAFVDMGKRCCEKVYRFVHQYTGLCTHCPMRKLFPFIFYLIDIKAPSVRRSLLYCQFGCRACIQSVECH
jgi:hypothetical protein